jgi:hypothetical protein
VIERKLAYREVGGAGAWWQLVLSGVLANWLVGMAAFFAFMGRRSAPRSSSPWPSGSSTTVAVRPRAPDPAPNTTEGTPTPLPGLYC